MLSLSVIRASQGRTYYRKENYYSKEDSREYSAWWGKGAEDISLQGEIQFKSFDNLLQGYTPLGDELLSQDQIRKLSDKRLEVLTKRIDKAVSHALHTTPRKYPFDGKDKLETSRDRLRNKIVEKILGEIGGVTVSGKKAERAIDAGIDLLRDAQYNSAPLGKGKNTHVVELSQVSAEELKEATVKIRKAINDVTVSKKLDGKKTLYDLKREAVRHNLMAAVTKRNPTEKELANFQKLVEKSVDNEKLSGKRIEIVLGKLLKAAPSVPQSEKVAFRAELHLALKDAQAYEKRAALDATFSAPKSVSVQALVFGKEEITEAHRRAVDKAMAVMEARYSTYRTGHKGAQVAEVSGKLIVAQFEHDTSRALDPQLHTHNAIMNLVPTGKNEDGSTKYQALYTEDFFKNSKLGGVIYKNELALELKKLGYEIITVGDGSFEIKGMSPEQLRTFSKRRLEVEKNGGLDAKSARTAVLKGRAPKGPELPRSELVERWQKEAKDVGIKEISANPSLAHFRKDLSACYENALEIIREKNSAFRREDLELTLLSSYQGHFRFEEIQKFIDKEIGRSILPAIDGRLVAMKTLETERKYISLATKTLDCMPAILSEEKTQAFLKQADVVNKGKTGFSFTQGQAAAITNFLRSRDAINIWQGVAGAGKTTSLQPLVKFLKKQGYEVRGFAQSAQAANELSSGAGIKTTTLETFLLSTPEPKSFFKKPPVYIVDECSMISSLDMLRILKRRVVEGARVILIGDTRQLSAVASGNPFSHMQRDVFKKRVTELDQSVRQKDKLLKEVVALMNEGKMKEGAALLKDKFVEASDKLRAEKVAELYMKLSPEDRKKTLVLAMTNEERKDITNKIREAKRAEGSLGKEVHINTFDLINLNDGQSKIASNYKVGEYVRPNETRKDLGLSNQVNYKISAIDRVKNSITITNDKGIIGQKTISLDKFNSFQLMKESSIEVHLGEKGSWTKNHKVPGADRTKAIYERSNNEKVFFESIKDGFLTLRYEDGRSEKINLNERHFLGMAEVLTAHKSQGMTAERTIVSLSGRENKETLYVEVTRAKSALLIVGKNFEEFTKNVEKTGANEIASDLVKEIPSFKPNKESKVPKILKDTIRKGFKIDIFENEITKDLERYIHRPK